VEGLISDGNIEEEDEFGNTTVPPADWEQMLDGGEHKH
jgi:hypothetical protein